MDDFEAIEQQILEELRRLEAYAHNLAVSLEAIQNARKAQRKDHERVFKAAYDLVSNVGLGAWKANIVAPNNAHLYRHLWDEVSQANHRKSKHNTEAL